MKAIKYTNIKGPKTTTSDYLKSLDNDELQNVYGSSFMYGISLPGLIKKLQDELQRRNMTTQPALF